MANVLYLISSLFFVIGSILALRESSSAINWVYLLGATFFCAAASVSLFWRKR